MNLSNDYEQGRLNMDRARGAVKKFRAMENYEKQKKSLPIMLATVQQ